MRTNPKLDGKIENMEQFLKDMLADWAEVSKKQGTDSKNS